MKRGGENCLVSHSPGHRYLQVFVCLFFAFLVVIFVCLFFNFHRENEQHFSAPIGPVRWQLEGLMKPKGVWTWGVWACMSWSLPVICPELALSPWNTLLDANEYCGLLIYWCSTAGAPLQGDLKRGGTWLISMLTKDWEGPLQGDALRISCCYHRSVPLELCA